MTDVRPKNCLWYNIAVFAYCLCVTFALFATRDLMMAGNVGMGTAAIIGGCFMVLGGMTRYLPESPRRLLAIAIFVLLELLIMAVEDKNNVPHLVSGVVFFVGLWVIKKIK